VLRTSRANPTQRREDLQRKPNPTRPFTSIACHDGAMTPRLLLATATAAEGAIRVAHIPKTIDNDCPPRRHADACSKPRDTSAASSYET
jgi:6-phosphofructokinase 1